MYDDDDDAEDDSGPWPEEETKQPEEDDSLLEIPWPDDAEFGVQLKEEFQEFQLCNKN